ncbi:MULTISPECIES: FAD-binding oxidoreductase [unclassified Gluconobacter]|uniref:FAD-binding oxidoreductase n=1 Tax=unclassified Gluconobacter TaxID=2644261 RepID=UPI0017714E8B|nr:MULTISPECIES: FAD-binding oxidoreductase [unclassified Gluconobacter]GFE97096.1 FAD-linked oxidase [Gluconobacter sp. Gdi]
MSSVGTFLSLLGDIPVQTVPALVKRKSRDFYWYSPVLKRQLDSCFGDCIVMPRNEEDLLHIARAARETKTFLTPRGGGTGNYGQAVPMEGGAVVEMTELNKLLWVKDGVARVQAGMNMLDLDRALHELGWEARMYPSTKRTATIGGFIAGGSGGIGSVRWGGLSSPGNILGLRFVTLGENPEALELRGSDARGMLHTYGTTGLITELEIGVEPAVDWQDMAISFGTFEEAAVFARDIALQAGIQKKLVSVVDGDLPPFFASVREHVPDGASLVILMVAPAGIETVKALAEATNGHLCYEANTREAEDTAGATPLYELTWNHTTLQVLKKDRGYTYLQCGYPAVGTLEKVAEIRALFPDDLMMHLEFFPMGGHVSCAALPVIRFTDEARLNHIIAEHEKRGVNIANPHVVTIEEGGMHRVASPDLAAIKKRYDPMLLLNPGKMLSAGSA